MVEAYQLAVCGHKVKDLMTASTVVNRMLNTVFMAGNHLHRVQVHSDPERRLKQVSSIFVAARLNVMLNVFANTGQQ